LITAATNRPFDDFTVVKNGFEANAKLFIQSLVKYKRVALFYSFMSQIEIDDSPFEERKEGILNFIESNAVGFIGTKRINEIEALANQIIRTGIKKKDATHLACAIISKCDYFLTTDRRLLKCITDRIKIVNPITFVEMWGETE
jgi:predicted nucleic acid-binding protein